MTDTAFLNAFVRKYSVPISVLIFFPLKKIQQKYDTYINIEYTYKIITLYIGSIPFKIIKIKNRSNKLGILHFYTTLYTRITYR